MRDKREEAIGGERQRNFSQNMRLHTCVEWSVKIDKELTTANTLPLINNRVLP